MIVSRKRKKVAFTLAELTVVIALFGLFSTTALASLSLTMRHWKTISTQTDVYSCCRTVINTVSKELRQSMPCQASGFLTYYKETSSSSTTDLTAVLEPCIKNQTSTTLSFSEANPSNFSPLDNSFSDSSPVHYRFVRYYVLDNKLHREVKQFSSSGSLTSTVDDIVAQGENMSFRVTCLSADTYQIQFSCEKTFRNETKKASLGTTVIIVGA